MKLSNAEVKRQNKIAVYRQVLRVGRITKPELSAQLRLSLPTVGQIITELMEAGLVAEDGAAESLGGRRALYYVPVLDKLALGVDITQNHVSLALVNLSGQVVTHKRTKLVLPMNPDTTIALMPRFTAFWRRTGSTRHA